MEKNHQNLMTLGRLEKSYGLPQGFLQSGLKLYIAAQNTSKKNMIERNVNLEAKMFSKLNKTFRENQSNHAIDGTINCMK